MDLSKEASTLLTSPTFGFLLKLIAALFAAVFGFLGLREKAHDERGQLTRRGWVAALGIIGALLIGAASATYDFVQGRKAAESERTKTQRLLLAAERGIYPLRGITATAFIELPSKAPGLLNYISEARRSLPRTPDDCRKTRVCRANDDTESYDIPLMSPLFPKPSSDLGKLLKYLKIHASFIGGNTASRPSPHNLGTFDFPLIAPDPGESMLMLTPLQNGDWLVRYLVVSVRIRDRDALESGVYSLADAFPGAVGASVGFDDKPLCDSYEGLRNCEPLIGPDNGGLALKTLSLTFDYPKVIRLDASVDVMCATRSDGTMTVRLLPDSLDDVDDNGQFLRPVSKPDVCAYVDKPRTASPPVFYLPAKP